jgi:hypothetical protein
MKRRCDCPESIKSGPLSPPSPLSPSPSPHPSPPYTPFPFPHPPPLPRVYEKFSKVNMQDENANSQLERREKIHQHANIVNYLID